MTVAHARHAGKSANEDTNPTKKIQSLAEGTVQKATAAVAAASTVLDDDHDGSAGEHSPMSELLEADGGDALGSLDYENGGDSPVREGRGRGRHAARGGRARGRGRSTPKGPKGPKGRGPSAPKNAAKRQRK